MTNYKKKNTQKDKKQLNFKQKIIIYSFGKRILVWLCYILELLNPHCTTKLPSLPSPYSPPQHNTSLQI